LSLSLVWQVRTPDSIIFPDLGGIPEQTELPKRPNALHHPCRPKIGPTRLQTGG
jgi:hypothetical protein